MKIKVIIDVLQQICNMLQNINSFLIVNIDSGNLLSVSTILFTLLIPVAIFLLQDDTIKKDKFDRQILLTDVIHVKRLLLSIFFLGLAQLFWKISSFQLMLIVFYILGVYLIFTVFHDSFKWASETINDDYRNNKRLLFIRKQSNTKQVELWSLLVNSINGSDYISKIYWYENFLKSLKSNHDLMQIFFYTLIRKDIISDYSIQKQIISFIFEELLAVNNEKSDYRDYLTRSYDQLLKFSRDDSTNEFTVTLWEETQKFLYKLRE